MKRLFLFAMVLCGTMTTTAQDKQLFDDNWQFTRNGKTTNVNLPHDWDIYEGPNSGKGATPQCRYHQAPFRRCLSEGRGLRQRTEGRTTRLWLHAVHH